MNESPASDILGEHSSVLASMWLGPLTTQTGRNTSPSILAGECRSARGSGPCSPEALRLVSVRPSASPERAAHYRGILGALAARTGETLRLATHRP